MGNLLIDSERRLVVVSKDHDYDSVIKFWKTRIGADIVRIDNMGAGDSNNISAKINMIKSSNNLEQCEALSKIGYKDAEIQYVQKLLDKHLIEKNGKQQIYRNIVSKYGQEKGLKLYRDVKKIYC